MIDNDIFDNFDLPVLKKGVIYKCCSYDIIGCDPWKRVPYIFKSMAVMHYNVRDLGSISRFAELKCDLKNMPFQIDFLGISETWHRNGRENLFNI
jgi:hypothetical protein